MKSAWRSIETATAIVLAVAGMLLAAKALLLGALVIGLRNLLK